MEKPEKMKCEEALGALHDGTMAEQLQAGAHVQSCAKCQARISDAQNPEAAFKRELLFRLDEKKF